METMNTKRATNPVADAIGCGRPIACGADRPLRLPTKPGDL
jgi:hypothetical protein